MGLTEEMRAAVDASPPSGIDLDELVQKGRARRTRSRAAMGVAGVAGFVAVALGTVGAYSLTATSHTNRPVGVGGPGPAVTHPYVTPSTTRIIVQLQDAVQAFPASMHVPDDVHFSYGGKDAGAGAHGYYYASWTFGHVNYSVDVYVRDFATPNFDACAPGHRGDPSLGCTQVADQFGTTVTVSNAKTVDVENFRANGTHVTVFAGTTRSSAQIPSKADVQAAAHTPGLTIDN